MSGGEQGRGERRRRGRKRWQRGEEEEEWEERGRGERKRSVMWTRSLSVVRVVLSELSIEVPDR